MNKSVLILCTSRLLDWYTTHFRSLPWRDDPTPYRVWISEIMLQQTRIEAVLPYYERFINRLPDPQALASVPEDTLLKLWEGLGYYSRARNLQKAASILCERYDNQLPADYAALLSLPGIGEYTAGAIASIAFSIPVPAVDGNVMRVLSRLTGDDTDVLSAGSRRHFSQIAEEMLPQDQPGRFNQALMELGETICVPNTQPHCDECPLRDLCVAYASDLTETLPIRIKRTKRRIQERVVYLVITQEHPRRVLLHKRPSTGLLAGLWELPNGLVGEEIPLPSTVAPLCYPSDRSLPDGKHLFSHIEWHMHGKLLFTDELPLPDGYVFASLDELLHIYALPSAFSIYADLLPIILNQEDV